MVLPSISVVIPALNEAQNIPHVFSRIPPDVYEVILVDGYSIDDTVAVARRLRPEVRVVRQTRMGKGNALACGIAVATGDIVATVDADGSADPGEIPRFVEALLTVLTLPRARGSPKVAEAVISRACEALVITFLQASSMHATVGVIQIYAMDLTYSGGTTLRFWD